MLNKLVDVKYHRNIENLLKYDGIIIYGIGSHFDEVYALMKDRNISILVVCDKNPDKQGKTIFSMKILSPAEAMKL